MTSSMTSSRCRHPRAFERLIRNLVCCTHTVRYAYKIFCACSLIFYTYLLIFMSICDIFTPIHDFSHLYAISHTYIRLFTPICLIFKAFRTDWNVYHFRWRHLRHVWSLSITSCCLVPSFILSISLYLSFVLILTYPLSPSHYFYVWYWL